MNNQTLGFYNANAETYAAHARSPNPRLFAFLDRCKPGGRILELGTGGGVDAGAILQHGFSLDATDGSVHLAAIASKRLGQTVRSMLFHELDASNLYDGVYACASLTHVPRAELGAIIAKIYRATVDGGIVWASFKAGADESADALGRHYNYLSQDELISLWEASAPWRSIEAEAWIGGAYDRSDAAWVAVTAWK